jgi:hypothetical protein
MNESSISFFLLTFFLYLFLDDSSLKKDYSTDDLAVYSDLSYSDTSPTQILHASIYLIQLIPERRPSDCHP